MHQFKTRGNKRSFHQTAQLEAPGSGLLSGEGAAQQLTCSWPHSSSQRASLTTQAVSSVLLGRECLWEPSVATYMERNACLLQQLSLGWGTAEKPGGRTGFLFLFFIQEKYSFIFPCILRRLVLCRCNRNSAPPPPNSHSLSPQPILFWQ